MKKFKVTKNYLRNGETEIKEETVLAESFRKLIEDYDLTSRYPDVQGRKKNYDFKNEKFYDHIILSGTIVSVEIEGI